MGIIFFGLICSINLHIVWWGLDWGIFPFSSLLFLDNWLLIFFFNLICIANIFDLFAFYKTRIGIILFIKVKPLLIILSWVSRWLPWWSNVRFFICQMSHIINRRRWFKHFFFFSIAFVLWLHGPNQIIIFRYSLTLFLLLA